MKKVTKKQNWFKTITLTRKDCLYVGLDVHKDSISVALWLNGRISKTFRTPADYQLLTERFQSAKVALKKVVYEAGPTGFGLARVLRRAGLPVEVISPANTPRPSKRQSKTDKLDCKKLAEYAAKGMLAAVAIPSEKKEADRQVARLRDQLVKKRCQVKQQIRSFLLQHSLPDPSNWSQANMTQLRALFLSQELRFTLHMHLEELDDLTDKIKRTEEHLREMAEQSRNRQPLEILQSHPGVGPMTAWAFHTEVFRPGRFRSSAAVANYFGLSPLIHQSGETSREGPIVKTGRAALRSKMVEAAWRWIRTDSQAREVYNRLCRNTGSGKKAIVGMARRLVIHLWCMVCTKQHFHPAP